MNIINDRIIKTILSQIHPGANIELLEWNLNDNVIPSGEHFFNESYRLVIFYKKNGQQNGKRLFLKSPYNSPIYQFGIRYDIFEKELQMYTQVLRQMHHFVSEHFAPKIYFADDKHSLVMKDLSLSGYKVANRCEQLNFEHCVHALKCLAKLHGISVKLERTFGISDLVKKDCFYGTNERAENIMKRYFIGVNIFLEELTPELKKKYTQVLEKCKSITWEKLQQDILFHEDSFNVLNHGDYWTNNIMFKYSTFRIVEKAKMIDFQQCKWTNPTVDLIFFTVISMKFEVFEKYYDLLLQIYLDSLNEIFTLLNCAAYDMELLKTDIDKRHCYFIFVLFFLLPIALSNPTGSIDIQEMIKNGDDVDLMKKAYFSNRYLATANKWISYFEKNKTIFSRNSSDGPFGGGLKH